MCLVALALEPAKKTANAGPSFVPRPPVVLARFAVEQPDALFGRHIAEGDAGSNARSSCALQHPFLHLPIGRCAPRHDQALAQRKQRIWHHLFEVEFDRTAKSFAFGAGADRAVGRKQRRCWLLETLTALRTIEPAIKLQRGCRAHFAVIAFHAEHPSAAGAEIEGLFHGLANALCTTG